MSLSDSKEHAVAATPERIRELLLRYTITAGIPEGFSLTAKRASDYFLNLKELEIYKSIRGVIRSFM